MTDRDILDQIDDAITWHGSRDAMRWTAEPPQLGRPPLPRIDPDAAAQLFVSINAQVEAFAEALRPVAEGLARNFAAVTKAFNEIANMPGMRELADAHRLERSAMRQAYDRRRRARGRRR